MDTLFYNKELLTTLPAALHFLLYNNTCNYVVTPESSSFSSSIILLPKCLLLYYRGIIFSEVRISSRRLGCGSVCIPAFVMIKLCASSSNVLPQFAVVSVYIQYITYTYIKSYILYTL